MRRFASLILILFSNFYYASAFANCPIWLHDPETPSCPKTGVSKLDETFPAMAYVISDALAGNRTRAKVLGISYAANLATEILEAAGVNQPQILIQAGSENFSAIKDLVRQKIVPNHSAAEVERILANLKRVDVPTQRIHDWHLDSNVVVPVPEVWQQDYFTSLFDPTTGGPVLRQIDPDRGGHVDSLYRAVEDCPLVSRNSRLFTSQDGFVAGSRDAGGNMQALPGGMCLHGDNQSPSVSRIYCGPKENEVVLDTSWLSVGHVDEIVNVVPAPKGKAPCNFAVNLASPRKALELMQMPENAAKPFFDFAGSKSTFADAVYDRDGAGTLLQLCQAFQRERDLIVKECEERPESIPEIDKGLLLSLIRKIRDVDAIRPWHEGDYDLLIKGCDVDRVAGLTNKEVAYLFTHDQHLSAVTDLIQSKMDMNRKILEGKLRERFPTCKTSIIEVPNLFDGADIEIRHGKPAFAKTKPYPDGRGGIMVLPVEQSKSLLPNPTNGIVVRNSYLVPHPRNQAFRAYLEKEWSKLGLTTRFIDSYRELHFGGGELHCATNALRVCRP